MRSRIIHLFSLLMVLLGTYACNQLKTNTLNYRDYYDLNRPLTIDSLPDVLLEISGIHAVSAHLFGCVQDEQGKVFFYDTEAKKIQEQAAFGPGGDYEELTLADSVWFVLRSDGLLYEITSFGEEPEVTTHPLDLPTKDHEGLCYDKTTHSLYLAAKRPLGKDRTNEDIRIIYAFDLVEKKLKKEPLFLIHVSHIQEFAFNHNLPVPQKANKKGISKKISLQFRPSSMAIHPLTQDIFILSASDPILLIIDKEGIIKDYFPLDPDMFNKPEGITFTESGDMLISNEGKKGEKRPTLMRFKWNQSE